MHPQTARKQGCENNLEESLLSEDSDDDHVDNDPDDDYSASTDDGDKKKKSLKKRPPRVPLESPGKLTGKAGHHLPRKRRRQF